jgi:hypothetical protein
MEPSTMASKEFPGGMTVAELKALVSNWAETDDTGSPLEVWVDTGAGLFRPIVRAVGLGAAEPVEGMLPATHLMLHTDAELT